MVFSSLLADLDSCGNVCLLHRDALTRLVLLDTVLDAGLVAVDFFVSLDKPLNLLGVQGPNAGVGLSSVSFWCLWWLQVRLRGPSARACSLAVAISSRGRCAVCCCRVLQ